MMISDKVEFKQKKQTSDKKKSTFKYLKPQFTIKM